MEPYRKLKLLRINCWTVGVSGFVTFLSGCWFTYSGFCHPSQDEYEHEKMENKFIYQNNGTRVAINGMYGPQSLVLGSSFLAVLAGFLQLASALVMLLSHPVKKMIGKTGNYLLIIALITVALVLTLIISIVTDPARSHENPSQEIKKNFFKSLAQGKNLFAIIIGCDIVLLVFSVLCVSILYRTVSKPLLGK